jgi:hypothetical protein
MKFHLNLKRITKFSLLFGMACLLVSITLFSVPSPGEAATVEGKGNCSEGWISKDSNAPFKYNGDQNVCKVIVKAGSQNQDDQNACTGIKFPPAKQTDSSGCYSVSGLGSSSVSVSKIGTGDSCKDISHVEFYPCQVEVTPTEPTPTDPTPTDPTPTEPTPTEPTPTDPTPTDSTPTDSPETVTPTDPPETVTPTDPAETEIPTDSPETVTPTDPPKTVTPTEPVRTPTPPPTLSQPTPQKTDSPLILIPVTGVDLSSSNQIYNKIPWMFLFMGVGFLGISMIFHGISTKKSRKPKK